MTTARGRTGRGSGQTRRLSTGECRDWLVSHREGRLGYLSGRGPRSVVVCYAVADDQIMFRLPDYNDIVHYAPGEHVTLEVEGRAPSPAEFETVRVSGTASRAEEQQTTTVDSRDLGRADLGQADLPAVDLGEQWPAGVLTSLICLPMTEVEGFERELG